jgi:hypothetical protein
MEQSKVCVFGWKRNNLKFLSFGWNNSSQKEGLWLLDENNNQKGRSANLWFINEKP